MFLFRQGHLLMYHVNMRTSSEPSVQLLRLVYSFVSVLLDNGLERICFSCLSACRKLGALDFENWKKISRNRRVFLLKS
jgi:hypothetical protein